MIPYNNYCHKNSGIGKIAAIMKTDRGVNYKKDAALFEIKSHYDFLKNYCKYDKVYISLNNITGLTKEDIKNSLKNYVDELIYDLSEENILVKLKVNDVYMPTTANNYFGGVAVVFMPFTFLRLTEWKEHNPDNNLICVQDDPEWKITDPWKTFYKRLIVDGSLRLSDTKNPIIIKKLENINDKLINKAKIIDEVFKEVIVAFCGIDYNIFFDKMKDNKKPTNVVAWCNFNSYIYNGVNYHLEEKFKDYSYADKKYDCEYHGGTKMLSRIKRTEEYYKVLNKKFMHVFRSKPFFKNLTEEHFDSYSPVIYEKLHELICSNAKSTFISHDLDILGNQLSPRCFDSMLGDIVAIIDEDFDKEHRLCDNEELEEFMYVKNPKEFKERVEKISNDELYYKHIKKLQRRSIFNKFKDYIEENNLELWKKILEK